MKKFWLYFLVVVLFFVLFQHNVFAFETFNISHRGKIETVRYDFYFPSNIAEGEKLPVLVCLGGLPVYDGVYAYSNTQECMTDVWKNFADENHLAVLGLGFLFISDDWEKKESYQYPSVWSGQALKAILNILGQKFPIDQNKLFMYGISAGAQFSVRFAQMEPKKVVAVTSHAAGGYDEPEKFIPVKFLLTVGSLDNDDISRREMAREFTDLSRKKDIDVTLEIIEGLGHRQTLPQDEMSRTFIKALLDKIKIMGR